MGRCNGWRPSPGPAKTPRGRKSSAGSCSRSKSQPGVSQVNLTWEKAAKTKGRTAVPDRSAEMSPIGYFYPPDGKTVGLRGELLDQAGKPLGRFEVVLNYDYLMQDILTEGWMVAQMACLVNQEGHYLAHSSSAMQARHCLGETQDPLELAMLKAMKEKHYGTLMGEGYIPEHVIGYYKLRRPRPGPSCCTPRAARSWPLFCASASTTWRVAFCAWPSSWCSSAWGCGRWSWPSAASPPRPPWWPREITANPCRWPAGMKSAS